MRSDVGSPSLAEQAFLGIPFSLPDGNAGDITIRTPVLSIDGAFGINVQSVGAGNAGNARIVANSLRLNNSAEIRGRTFSSEGGNIDLQIRDSLVMKSGSRLTVESDGTGNGGNISISAPAVVAVGNTVAANPAPMTSTESATTEVAAEEVMEEAIAWQRSENGRVTLTASPDEQAPNLQTAQCLNQQTS